MHIMNISYLDGVFFRRVILTNMQLLLVQPLITLESSISYTFPTEGIHTVIVHVAAANIILQDSKAIVVKGRHCYGFNCVLYGSSLFQSLIMLCILCTSELEHRPSIF